MAYVSLLIKPASSACDLRCAYCFYRDVALQREVPAHSLMNTATMQAVIDRALAVGDDATISFAFQGGEPTLAGLGFFERFVAYVAEKRTHQHITYALQTNGMSIDDAWAAFCARHRVLVGVSIDGERAVHDALRPDASGEPTHKRALAAYKLLRDVGVEVNVLSVLTPQLAAHPQRVFSFLLREGVDYVQFIPCLAGLAGEGAEFALTPADFSAFYRTLLRAWLRELERGVYVSVGLFDDVMRMALGQRPLQCGALGRCALQFVVEANGSVYPCDFYALDEWCMGSVAHHSLEEMAHSAVAIRFLSEPRPACASCSTCRFEGMCHKNCRRMSSALYDEEFCGYRAFLEEGYEPLAQAAHRIARGGLRRPSEMQPSRR